MEHLERIWEAIGLFFGGLLRGFERSITSLFGSSNARYIKKLQPKLDAIGALEDKYKAMSDEELRQQTERFKERLAAGETLDDILIEAFAVCREGGRRFLEMRHYDVQLIGGIVLHSGSIAEMVTGEGKTLVATLPAYLNALEGQGVHVVTVNDYLARRDMEWMGPLYMGLGLTVGAIQSDMPVDARQKAYSCDITYGTNNEFGFDYLRDNMRPAARGDKRYPSRLQQSQGPLHFAIVDEVDNILIDEARTPLIISGPAHDNVRKYAEADRIARQLKKDKHFTVNEKDHTANLTEDGVREAEKMAGVESFYTAGNMEWPHLLDNSLKAHYLYHRDVNYTVKDGKVVIVDEFTGRLMEGRQWSDGLHQAVEAKEGVKIKEETQTLATITLQNFFKLYDKICGMTGTAMTEAGEFWKIYQLDVVAIPTNRTMQRQEFPDVIYRTEKEKYEAVAEEIEQLTKWDVLTYRDGSQTWGEIIEETDTEFLIKEQDSGKKETVAKKELKHFQRKGRPVLVGTVSIEKSERVAGMLDRRGIPHAVLNAKYHKREAEIVAQAGRRGAVTIATNMAGRGTDIVLGGNAETMAWAKLQDKYPTRLDVPREEWDALVEEIEIREKMKEQGEELKELGGLHVIGTERHDARRIDLQLRGRCGRQGDPGSSRFFLSLEDDLMRIFAGEWVKSILDRLGMKDGERIESRMVTRRIEAAQKKREEHNFEIRKSLLEYDEVMDEQRKRTYKYRQQILEGVNCRRLILSMIEQQVASAVNRCTARDFNVEVFAAFAGTRLSVPFENARQFRGMDFDQADSYAKDEAVRRAESDIFEAIEENLPHDSEDQTEWNWEALARLCNTRWGTNFRDRDLKKVGRDHVDTTLLNSVREAINKVDLSEGAPMLHEDFGLRQIANWVRNKFTLPIEFEEIEHLEDAAQLKALICRKAEESYDTKEAEYPVMAGLYRYSKGSSFDRDGIIAWARERFEVEISEEDYKNKQREELHDLLLQQSRINQQRSREVYKEGYQRISELYPHGETSQPSGIKLGSLVDWLNDTLRCEFDAEKLAKLNREEVEEEFAAAVGDRFHPEMRRMERGVLLEIVDSAWKDHLHTMDYLRSAVSHYGWGQLDPKVEYKREGMRLYEQMWTSIDERATDLIFRMEELNEEFVGSTWVETAATHAQAESSSDIARQQEEAINNSRSEVKLEPIRNRGQTLGRNDPCHCGSGKKYKNCCMRKEQVV